jgi:FkbM family methyltransferase
MIPLKFAYRGATLCVVAPNESDAIPAIIQQSGSFYELDVLERCEFYVKRRQVLQKGEVIVDVGAYIGNHTVFFANFCPAERVIALEACKPSFEALTQTISCNGLKNVSAYHVAIGDRHDWGATSVSDPDNLGANRVERSHRNGSDAVPIAPLDAFLESMGFSQSRVSLMKIDVEGMESEVVAGARGTIARSRPILCIELLDGPHMQKLMRVLKGSSYLIRECGGPAASYLLTWEARIPRLLIRAINYGWLLLARYGGSAMRWRYRRAIEIALPT